MLRMDPKHSSPRNYVAAKESTTRMVDLLGDVSCCEDVF